MHPTRFYSRSIGLAHTFARCTLCSHLAPFVFSSACTRPAIRKLIRSLTPPSLATCLLAHKAAPTENAFDRAALIVNWQASMNREGHELVVQRSGVDSSSCRMGETRARSDIGGAMKGDVRDGPHMVKLSRCRSPRRHRRHRCRDDLGLPRHRVDVAAEGKCIRARRKGVA